MVFIFSAKYSPGLFGETMEGGALKVAKDEKAVALQPALFARRLKPKTLTSPCLYPQPSGGSTVCLLLLLQARLYLKQPSWMINLPG